MLLWQTQSLKVFTPELSDLWTGLIASAALFLAFAVAGLMLYGKKSDDARVRVVLPMLCYMAALLALVSAGGHYLTVLKYPEIGFNKFEIYVDGEPYRKPRPGDVRVESVNDQLTGATNQILLVQIDGQKTLALPGNRYPIKEIMQLVKK